jgi:DNA-binding CsgD family transcriptional regulator
MEQFILWFNMIGFTLTVATAGLAWLEYVKHRDRWLRDYLLYQGAHGFWLLFATYVFFDAVFLAEPIEWLETAFAYLRLAVSLGVAVYGLRFYLQLAGIEHGPVLRWSVALFVAIIAVTVAVGMGLESGLLLGSSSVLFNITLAAASLTATRRLRYRPAGRQRMMFPFVLYSTIAFVALAVGNVWFGFFAPQFNYLQVNVLAGGAFVFVWSLIVGAVFLRRARLAAGADQGLPEEFKRDFNITNREAEIIQELADGATSKAIGEKLFISQRTVETHIYNIYRKCDVGNRMELVRRLRRY